MEREIERAKKLERELKALTEQWAKRDSLTPNPTPEPQPRAPQGALRG